MKLTMYAMKDRLSGYQNPISFQNEEVAKRWFKTNVEENPTIRNNADQFELVQMGTFDTETGEFIQDKTEPKLIQGGGAYVRS